MSRSQLARTPDNFPRMKHRAAGRIARKRGHGKMTVVEALNVFAVVGRFVNDAVDSLIGAFEGIARAFRPEPTQADFVLTPPPLLPPMQMQTRPQDWAPAARGMLWPEPR
ncbi:hypothetical protein SEA_VIBAKI_58 [Arthrobacter phage Vibaki]|uniref:Uncharacterized protein n=1 Tax=Arthrobacter phage Vibaki TaxID=2593333 RepID=A0A514TZ07_9CAUD|nr:hypothetical protein HYP95_gp58 [Arthrobacter phage Vibaki]QDK01938.1 hypothetical protein SEA_VIBAKI_58 [Arthrobacter phage Vibaki]